MAQGKRDRLSTEQRIDMWRRWRKIAAITLIVWKKEVHFDASYLKSQAA